MPHGIAEIHILHLPTMLLKLMDPPSGKAGRAECEASNALECFDDTRAVGEGNQVLEYGWGSYVVGCSVVRIVQS